MNNIITLCDSAPAQLNLFGWLIRGETFTGPSMLDIIIIVFLVFAILRLFSERRRDRDDSSPNQPRRGPRPLDTNQGHDDDTDAPRYRAAQAAWDRLRSEPATPTGSANADAPDDFGADDFLRGAKLAFARIVEAGLSGDDDEVREFSTENGLDDLRRTLPRQSGAEEAEALITEAKLENVDRGGTVTRATVRFEALVRSSVSEGFDTNLAQRWTFVRNEADSKSNWLLDSIESV
jgi:predicted lipid-binding transport protein (Tim44 family)